MSDPVMDSRPRGLLLVEWPRHPTELRARARKGLARAGARRLAKGVYLVSDGPGGAEAVRPWIDLISAGGGRVLFGSVRFEP